MRVPFNGSYPITQGFGNKLILNGKDVYAQWGMRGHNGIDYGLPMGTPVVASVTGKVYRGWDEGGYGNYIFLTGEGYECAYGHLAAIDVAQGANVVPGQPVGRSGNSGFSTDPHLHFGTRPVPYNRNNGYLGYIDPLPLIAQDEIVKPSRDQVIKHFQRFEGYTPTEAQIAYYLARDWGTLNGEILEAVFTRYSALKQKAIFPFTEAEYEQVKELLGKVVR